MRHSGAVGDSTEEPVAQARRKRIEQSAINSVFKGVQRTQSSYASNALHHALLVALPLCVAGPVLLPRCSLFAVGRQRRWAGREAEPAPFSLQTARGMIQCILFHCDSEFIVHVLLLSAHPPLVLLRRAISSLATN